jgi:hypothetical protein
MSSFSAAEAMVTNAGAGTAETPVAMAGMLAGEAGSARDAPDVAMARIDGSLAVQFLHDLCPVCVWRLSGPDSFWTTGDVLPRMRLTVGISLPQ